MERYSDLVRNLEDAVRDDLPRARQQPSALVGDRITLHPTEAGRLEAESRGDYAGLVALGQEKGPSGKTGANSELSLMRG